MAEIRLTAAPVLGEDLRLGENRIRERADLALVSVATPQGGEAALVKALEAEFGVAMPGPVASTQAGEVWAVPAAPDQLLLMFPHPTPDAERHVQDKLAGTGYTTEQTDSWVILDISGPDTLAALERLCPLDASAFETGDAARTVMEHMGAVILRLGPQEFRLMSASSSAGSFCHAIEQSFRNVI